MISIPLTQFCLFTIATRDTVAMGQKMADAGADALLVVTPCYYKSVMTPAALEKHYEKVRALKCHSNESKL